MPFYSQNIFRKSHQSVPLKSERFRNGSEKIGLGGIILPPPLGQGRVNVAMPSDGGVKIVPLPGKYRGLWGPPPILFEIYS